MTNDFAAAARRSADGFALDLRVDGMKCASCAMRIKESLEAEPGVEASLDFLRGQARLHWTGEAEKAALLAQKIEELGYRASLYREEGAQNQEQEEASRLLRCAAAAGGAALLAMAQSLTPLWPVPLELAVLSLALLYAARPFVFSAAQALRQGRTNMDVPIALALFLTAGLGVFEYRQTGRTSFFDSVFMLLFILLIGRYLDRKARGRAREAASALLSLFSGTATVVKGEAQEAVPLRALEPGQILLVAAGEKIGADGEVILGVSEVDASIITGETQPQAIEPGSHVFGGTVNLAAPIRVRIAAASENGLVGEVVRLMQKAEQSHARFSRLADRVARLYTPVVLFLAAATFLGWLLLGGMGWSESLLIAATVLIISCPCAMGLAVPAVHILASGQLFKKGILLKTADALERLAAVDTVVFDKTGTLTEGFPRLVNRADVMTEELKLAASLASQSRHPLSMAVLAAHGQGPLYALDVREEPGQGLEAQMGGEVIRLGRREWCGPTSYPADDKMELWLRIGYKPPRRLAFTDTLREDAVEVTAKLKKKKLRLLLLSGDRREIVEGIAQTLKMDEARALMTPMDKAAFIETLREQGHRVLMVGDGLNDAAALMSADVSLSPSSALDITQNAADLVFQGRKLSPVWEAFTLARKAHLLAQENIGLSVFYNALAVPLAVAGLASPLIAAAAMSLSSITVVLNAQRIRQTKQPQAKAG